MSKIKPVTIYLKKKKVSNLLAGLLVASGFALTLPFSNTAYAQNTAGVLQQGNGAGTANAPGIFTTGAGELSVTSLTSASVSTTNATAGSLSASTATTGTLSATSVTSASVSTTNATAGSLSASTATTGTLSATSVTSASDT